MIIPCINRVPRRHELTRHRSVSWLRGDRGAGPPHGVPSVGRYATCSAASAPNSAKIPKSLVKEWKTLIHVLRGIRVFVADARAGGFAHFDFWGNTERRADQVRRIFARQTLSKNRAQCCIRTGSEWLSHRLDAADHRILDFFQRMA